MAVRRKTKVKEEVSGETGEDGTCGWSDDAVKEFAKATCEARDRVREAAVRMADAAGLTPSARATSIRSRIGGHDAALSGNVGSRTPVVVSTTKIPKYTGRSDWEAFLAQFELLAEAEGWTVEKKALNLALSLTDDALSCLLLLNPADRRDYGALVGALQRRFGQCLQPELLRNELSNRVRKSGEPLRLLANDVENLTRRAYAHMSPGVQSELARDQFIRALTPSELRIQVQLLHPQTLQAALEMAVERENVWGVSVSGGPGFYGDRPARGAAVESHTVEKPAWVSEMTELLRAVSLQTARRPHPGPKACWGCGQAGHLVRECPNSNRRQGNDSGSA
ncbi:uncharacterized protein LOC144983599 [Oryzias latipes]